MTTPQHRPPQSEGPDPWVLPAAALIALAGLAAYAGSLHGRFLYDDTASIVDNPTIRRLWPPWNALVPPHGQGLTVDGRPVLNLSLAINYAISGTRVWSYHALNLVIHLCAGLALFGIARRTIERMRTDGRAARPYPTLFAFLIALLWTVHPLNTEAVTYIIQRAESLMGLFYLLTLYCFIRGVEPDGGQSADLGSGLVSGPLLLATGKDSRRQPTLSSAGAARHEARQRGDGEAEGRVPRGWPWRAPEGPTGPQHRLWYILSFFACLLGMGTKEVMATAPVMVFMFDRCFLAGTFREAWRRRRRYYLALAATWLPLLALLARSGGNRSGSKGFGLGVSWEAWLLTQPEAIARYLRLSVWPHPLVFNYGPFWAGPAAAAPALLLVAAFGAVSMWALARAPAWGFLGFWFFGILAVSSLVPGADEMIAEYRMYLPLAAVIVLAVAAAGRMRPAASSATRAAPPASATLVAGLVLAAVLGCLTWRRNLAYRSERAIWADTAAKRPGNAKAFFNLGIVAARDGRMDEAIADYEWALPLTPGDADLRDNLAVALADAGRTAEALAQCREAVRLRPDLPVTHYHLGLILAAAGQTPAAAAEFEAALRLQPGSALARRHLALARRALGDAAAQAGRMEEAAACYAAALQLWPDDAQAHNNLGNALAQLGRHGEAIAQYEAALRARPDYAEAHFNLADELFAAGRLEEARAHYAAGLRLRPDDAQARETINRIDLLLRR